MSEINLTIRDMSDGLRVRLDEPNEPAGSFRVMRNARITDRGGIAKRQGISVVGDFDAAGDSVNGLHHFEKADGTDILLKTKGTVHQYLDTTWESLETGLDDGKRHGYASHVVNEEAEDFVYYSSRSDNGYRRWRGWFDRLTTALVGAETEIPVTTTLKTDVHYGATAASSTATTITMAGTPWATDLWNGFVVRITSGAQSGKVSAITDTTSNVITITAIAGLTGAITFEVRQLAVPATGTILYNGTSIAYTGVANEDSLTVGAAHTAADNAAVVLVPTSYPENPRGDSLDVVLTRIYVGNIRSAMAKNGAGNDVATAVSRAVYVSLLKDGTDFTFAAPRAAGEGDIISFAYGGGRVLDVMAQENALYAGTPNYIEEITYSQDADDLPERTPLKPGIGLAGKFIKGKDDIYLFTPQGEFTSVGRVADLDSTPQSLDIGLPIKRLLNDRVNDEACGIEYRNRLHLAQKADSNSTHNDRLLIYNRGTKSFEGDWLFAANCFALWSDLPVFGESNGSNVMTMYSGEADTWDDVDYPISTEAKSNWINVTPSGMADQSVTGIHVAGYIRGNSSVTLYMFADFSETPVLTIEFNGTETDFIYSSNILASLGQLPLGEQPLASVDEADADGYRRFRFTVWFPDIYCNHLGWGMKSSGKDEYIEINQVGFTVSADPLTVGAGLVKT